MMGRIARISLALVFLLAFPVHARAQKLDLNAEYLRVQGALERNPDNATLKMDLAYLFSQGRETGRALDLYREVLARRPGDLRATTELCALLTETRDEKGAERHCRRIVELDAENPLSHDNLGLFYFKFGRFRESLKPFLDALALQPDNVLVRVHIAQVFLALKEYAVARDYLETLLADSAVGVEERFLIHHGLSLAYRELKQYDRAFTAIYETYKLSRNPLFLGKVVAAYLRAHQVAAFFSVGALILVSAQYFGRRLNRFLKNEES